MNKRSLKGRVKVEERSSFETGFELINLRHLEVKFSYCLVLFRIMCKANPKAVQVFEAQLFPPFQEILQKDVLEFHPYVFQGI